MQGVKQYFSASTTYPSYSVQYLRLADPFKRNELEQYYMQTYFHHLILIWIEMVCISC